MKPKLKKATYKDAQKITRLLIRRVRIIGNGVTVNLGIKAFKSSGASPAEVSKFKNKAWQKHVEEAQK